VNKKNGGAKISALFARTLHPSSFKSDAKPLQMRGDVAKGRNPLSELVGN